MKNCTRASFEKFFFPIFFGTPLAKDRFLGQNFDFLDISIYQLKSLRIFEKIIILKKTKSEQKRCKKTLYDNGCATRGHIGAYKNEQCIIFGGNWKKKARPTFVHEKIKKNQKPNENTAKIHIGSILECPKVRHTFFSSYLQISCTTRFCKLQYVLLRHDRHHMVFFCMVFALTLFFFKIMIFWKILKDFS